MVVEHLDGVDKGSRYVGCGNVISSPQQVHAIDIKVGNLLAQIFDGTFVTNFDSWKFLHGILQRIVVLSDI